MYDIAVRNLSTVITDAQLQAALPAFQQQVSRDFKSVWDLDATLHFFAKDAKPTASFWQLNVYDDADVAGALGYHDCTAAGKPLGKVFAGTTMKYGGLWTVTFSHELLEMILDPYINLTVADPDNKRSWSFEACDAVEDDSLGYKIGTTQVSDFILPSYFEPGITASKKRSFCGHLTHALTLATGGYMSYLDWGTGEYSQIDASRAPGHAEKHSRFHRRVKTERVVSSAE